MQKGGKQGGGAGAAHRGALWRRGAAGPADLWQGGELPRGQRSGPDWAPGQAHQKAAQDLGELRMQTHHQDLPETRPGRTAVGRWRGKSSPAEQMQLNHRRGEQRAARGLGGYPNHIQKNGICCFTTTDIIVFINTTFVVIPSKIHPSLSPYHNQPRDQNCQTGRLKVERHTASIISAAD